jgi:hypothetical protein
MTLSTPVKIVALAGLCCALALAGLLVLAEAHHRSASPGVASVTRDATPPHVARKPRLHLVAGLPGPLYRALEQSRTVVAVLYAPHVARDVSVLAAGLQGAQDAHVGFAALDVARRPVALSLAAWQPQAADPAVLVVRRPGVVVTELDGWSDRTMVAQAAADARR